MMSLIQMANMDSEFLEAAASAELPAISTMEQAKKLQATYDWLDGLIEVTPGADLQEPLVSVARDMKKALDEFECRTWLSDDFDAWCEDVTSYEGDVWRVMWAIMCPNSISSLKTPEQLAIRNNLRRYWGDTFQKDAASTKSKYILDLINQLDQILNEPVVNHGVINK